MTGAEVFIKKDKTCVLGKVRHDGYDVVDFFTPSNLKRFHGSPKDLWNAYRMYRAHTWGLGSSNDPLFDDDDIETRFIGGFEFSIEGGEDFDNLMQMSSDLIEQIDPDDGYLCGYSDYCLVVEFIPGDVNNKMGGYEVTEGKECFEDAPDQEVTNG